VASPGCGRGSSPDDLNQARPSAPAPSRPAACPRGSTRTRRPGRRARGTRWWRSACRWRCTWRQRGR